MGLKGVVDGDENAFRKLTDPYRRELQVHLYRLVGSLQDAQDLLQETHLAAWRGLEQFEERASIRTWLYRIATNRALDALRARDRRPDTQTVTHLPDPTRWNEPLWLEPYPDVLLDGVPGEAHGPRRRVGETGHGNLRENRGISVHSARGFPSRDCRARERRSPRRLPTRCR